MRCGDRTMKTWSSYGNSFLRHLELPRKSEDILNMDTLSLPELLSALEAIQTYVKRTNTGKARIEIQHGMISINIENSKETSS